MPRAAAYVPSNTRPTAPPDYFDSLDALRAYSGAPRSLDRHAARPIPYRAVPSSKDTAKLLVCHDYKGGYCEREDERGYTFVHWHLIDTFIYFSHRRVSAPPPQWIRAAHRSGTKILGTLIFEWDEGKRDFDLLLGNAASWASEGVSTELADLLVNLAVERGFEGWLVNVEVPFEVAGKASVDQHIAAMLVWLRYLRDETKKRIPGGETMWYDGANREGVRWQNRLSEVNLPFAEQVDSIFLNYFWRPHDLAETTTMLQSSSLSADQLYFGLDVFGRGQLGGGGFETFRALDCVRKSDDSALALPTAPQPAFSLALFAPGWSVEHLGHSLTEREAWRKWWADEQCFWLGTAATDNVVKELDRMAIVRREERGVIRAREIAKALATGRRALPFFDYHAPIPSLPGAFKPITAYRSPKPALATGSAEFFTNFCLGNGHDFFINGRRVMLTASGWTDLDSARAFPSLAIPSPIAGVSTDLIEDDAWSGSCSLSIKTTQSTPFIMPICPVAGFEVPPKSTLTAVVHYKSPSPVQLILSRYKLPASNQIGEASGILFASNEVDDQLSNGWQRSSVIFTSVDGVNPSDVFYIGVSVAGLTDNDTSILIGQISLSSSSKAALVPVVSSLRWNDDNSEVTWSTNYEGGATLPPINNSSSAHAATCLFTLWQIDDTGNETFLGSTAENRFRIDRTKLLGTASLCCRAVLGDGTTATQARLPSGPRI